MSLDKQIAIDFMAAFKAKDMDKKNFLGLIKGEIQLESSKEGFNGDESVLKILTKMKKSLTISGDEDSLRELTYLEDYLPRQMSEEELRTAIERYITNEGLSSKKDMGKVMGYLKDFYGPVYDGKMASTITKEILV